MRTLGSAGGAERILDSFTIDEMARMETQNSPANLEDNYKTETL